MKCISFVERTKHYRARMMKQIFENDVIMSEWDFRSNIQIHLSGNVEVRKDKETTLFEKAVPSFLEWKDNERKKAV